MIGLENYITSDGDHPGFSLEFSVAPNHDLLNKNAILTISRAAEICSRAGVTDIKITSGWRPISYNKQIDGAPTSKHLTAQAIDIHDPDLKLGNWCRNNKSALREMNCAFESLVTTQAGSDPAHWWVHIQTVIPPSGNIEFNP